MSEHCPECKGGHAEPSPISPFHDSWIVCPGLVCDCAALRAEVTCQQTMIQKRDAEVARLTADLRDTTMRLDAQINSNRFLVEQTARTDRQRLAAEAERDAAKVEIGRRIEMDKRALERIGNWINRSESAEAERDAALATIAALREELARLTQLIAEAALAIPECSGPLADRIYTLKAHYSSRIATLEGGDQVA